MDNTKTPVFIYSQELEKFSYPFDSMFVTLIETSTLSPAIAGVVESELLAYGVRLYPAHEVKRIERKEAGIGVFCEDITIEGDLVLVAAGAGHIESMLRLSPCICA
jgi:hypothetical protein